MGDQVDIDKRTLAGRNRGRHGITLARAHVSRHLSDRLPYYLTREEASSINATGNEQDRLFVRVLWETGMRVSEAVSLMVGDVGAASRKYEFRHTPTAFQVIRPSNRSWDR